MHRYNSTFQQYPATAQKLLQLAYIQLFLLIKLNILQNGLHFINQSIRLCPSDCFKTCHMTYEAAILNNIPYSCRRVSVTHLGQQGNMLRSQRDEMWTKKALLDFSRS